MSLCFSHFECHLLFFQQWCNKCYFPFTALASVGKYQTNRDCGCTKQDKDKLCNTLKECGLNWLNSLCRLTLWEYFSLNSHWMSGSLDYPISELEGGLSACSHIHSVAHIHSCKTKKEVHFKSSRLGGFRSEPVGLEAQWDLTTDSTKQHLQWLLLQGGGQINTRLRILSRRICLFFDSFLRSILTFTDPSEEDLGLYTVEMSDNADLSSSYDFTAEGELRTLFA